MKIRMLCTLLLLLPACGNMAIAQGTDAEKSACRGDAQRFCKHTLAGGPFTVAMCLSGNKAKLSPKCRAVLASHGL